MLKTILEALAIMFIGLGMAVALGLLFAYPEMLLWNNCLVPAVPSIQPITWLQAWGIGALFALMFKNTAGSPDSALKEVNETLKQSNRIAEINSQNVADAANEARQAYSEAHDDAREILEAIKDRG